jgi:rhodanese-related sulfurtransferase
MNIMFSLSAEKVKEMLENNEVLLIDVREEVEYREEHIEGAFLLPLSSFTKEKLPKLEGKKLVIYCKGGVRGGKACDMVQKMGIETEFFNLEGGITAWKQKYDVIKGKKLILPLERQMQLVVGVGVLGFTLLGAFINPKFLILPAFFGAGLIFAGITGFCGMMRILALMPWNR